MKDRSPTIPLSRRQQEQPDVSLKAAVADLLDALEQACRERDRGLTTIARLEARLGLLQDRIQRLERTNSQPRSLAGLKQKRRTVAGNGQLALAFEQDG